jgi:light-regulated signal transduction histidine kinase (bacteriophytochrome)
VKPGLADPLHEAEATIRLLQEELAATNREVLLLTLQLEQRVQERTSQLKAANEELEAFSYSVSHDLRTPLRHIQGYVELLRQDSASTLSAEGLHYATVIEGAAERMTALIGNLLDFSRMGRTEMHQTRIDMNALVGKVVEELSPDTQGRKIEWKIGALGNVRGDPILLHQVWMNLLSNAVKYTQGRERAEIGVGRVTKEEEAVFHVRDNGAGFNMQYGDRLFGVFQRLHQEREFEGIGIGLANVRRIIARHGGKTWAEGKVGEGATFYFSLPDVLLGPG